MYIINYNKTIDEKTEFKKISIEYIKMLRSFRDYMPKDYSLKIIDKNNNYEFSIEDINNNQLLSNFTHFSKLYGTELLLIIKLIDLNLEEECANIIWELVKLSKTIDEQDEFLTKENYFFGLDMIYVASLAYPYLTRYFTSYINPKWNENKILILFPLVASLFNNIGWNRDTLAAYLECSHSNLQKIISNFSNGLNTYLSNSDNMLLFMGLITYKHQIVKPYYGDTTEITDTIISYFANAKLRVSREQVEEALLGIEKPKIEEQIKVDFKNTYTDNKFIYFQFVPMSNTPLEELELVIKHPHVNQNILGEFDEGRVNIQGGYGISRSITESKWKIKVKNNEIHTAFIPYTSKGEYKLSLFKNGIEIFNTSTHLTKGLEEKIEILNEGSIENGEFIPFDKSKKDFGIKFRLYNGKGIGEIYHPYMPFINVITGERMEKNMQKISYQNAGEYTIKFSPELPIEFIPGDFHFILWNEDKSIKLYEKKFSFVQEKKTGVFGKIMNLVKGKEDLPKATILSFGIFGFSKNYIPQKNIALTTPNLNRKATIGSYIGCMYSLDQSLFVEGGDNINIVVEVSVTDYDGNVVLETKWPDISFARKQNTCAFVVEEGELFEGHWTFKVKYNKQVLLSQSIPVMVEKS